ncbi:MAG: hypothetical protein EA383_13840 [Spirochaetaceae bacterium]|nr:MAG: hypothetical protein EA383_13840 [Spirochaetaceae bacterium]
MDNVTTARLAKLHSSVLNALQQRLEKADEFLLARDSDRVTDLELTLAILVDECGRQGTTEALPRIMPVLESLISHPAVPHAVRAVSNGVSIERVNDMLVSVILMSKDVRTVGLVERFRRALVVIAQRWDEPLPRAYAEVHRDFALTSLPKEESLRKIGRDTVFVPVDNALLETERVSGNLFVFGDLRPTETLLVDGSLYVFGSLFSPRITVAGTVWIRDAILGQGSNKLVCGGDLNARTIRGIECRCGGTVSAEVLTHATVIANEITADALLGGSTHGTHIYVRETGSPLNISTRLFVNVRSEFSVQIGSCAHPNTIILATRDEKNETHPLAQVQVRGAAWGGPCHFEFDGRNWNVKRSHST